MSQPNTSAIDKLERQLRRWGRYIVSADENPLLLTAILPLIPDLAWACVWKRAAPGRYALKDSTLDATQLTEAVQNDMNSAVNMFYGGVAQRLGQTLRVGGRPLPSAPITLRRKILLRSSGLTASRVHLVKSEDDFTVVEIYLRSTDYELEAPLIRSAIEVFYRVRKEAQKEYESPEPNPDRALYQEQQLFDVMLHEVKAWIGKDLGLANLFLYEGRDRMLYHRATTSLRVQPAFADSYKAVPQASDEKLIKYVEHNIEMLEDVDSDTKKGLIEALHQLKDTETIRANAVAMEKCLRLLLTALPQEPGTGVAGHTAITLKPEIYNSSSDGEGVWSTETYKTEWFALMLSIEQMFGLGKTGCMSAVPLMESGQIAGVLFVVREEPFAYERDLPTMMATAAQISPLLTMYRSRKFQHAIMAAASDVSARMTNIAAELLPIAFNVLLTVVWHIGNGSIERISMWGFGSRNSRYGLINKRDDLKKTERMDDPNSGLWRTLKALKTQIHEWSHSREMKVLERDDQEPTKWGLPRGYTEQYEKIIQSKLNSAVVAYPPKTENVVIMYFAEDVSVTRANLSIIARKLFSLHPIETLRKRPAEPIQEIIGETPQLKAAVRELELAAKKGRKTMLQGPTGAGKTLFAKHFHKLSGREGELITFVPGDAPDNLMQDNLFGHVKGAFDGANEDLPGLIELAQGGVLFIDDFDTVSRKTQGMLLNVVETGRVKRLGDNKERHVDFILLTATNHQPHQLSEKVRGDLISRFARRVIDIPRLNDRRMDIPLIVRKLLEKKHEHHRRLAPEAWLKLINADWPRGVRALEDVVDVITDIDADYIEADDIKPHWGFILGNGSGPVRLMDVSKHITYPNGDGDAASVQVFLDNHTYHPNESPRDDWGNLAARAFKIHKEQGRTVNSFLSVGCGAGLDAVAASLILNCERVVLADVHPEVVAFARENLLLNCPHLTLDSIYRCVSDLLSGLPDSMEPVDLIYENLPNLTPDSSEKDILGENHKSATFLHQTRPEEIPAIYKDYCLELHYAFLLSAKKYLKEGGSVICSIGARVDWEHIETMFIDLGYTPELLVFDFKEQEEAESVIGGYAKVEKKAKDEQRSSKLEFRFYPVSDARKILEEKQPTRRVSGFADIRQSTEEALKKFELSATDALEFHDGKERMGHMVYIVRGTPTVPAA